MKIKFSFNLAAILLILLCSITYATAQVGGGIVASTLTAIPPSDDLKVYTVINGVWKAVSLGDLKTSSLPKYKVSASTLPSTGNTKSWIGCFVSESNTGKLVYIDSSGTRRLIADPVINMTLTTTGTGAPSFANNTLNIPLQDTSGFWRFGFAKNYGPNAYLGNTGGYVNIFGRDGVNLGGTGWTTIKGSSVFLDPGNKSVIDLSSASYGVRMRFGNGINGETGSTQLFSSGTKYPSTALPNGNTYGDVYHRITETGSYGMYGYGSNGWTKFIDSIELAGQLINKATVSELQTEIQDRVNSANAIINAMDVDRTAVDTAKVNIRQEAVNNINYVNGRAELLKKRNKSNRTMG